MSIRYIMIVTLLSAAIAAIGRADWNQWRGPSGTGLAPVSPPLLERLPDDGLRPAWVSETIKSARDGGWGSPVIADGRVYLYAHTRTRLSDPGERKYPWLPPDKRTGMTDKEYQEYEVKRRDEDERRANAYQFREAVHCFDLKAGEPLWTDHRDSIYSRFPQSGTPTVLGGRLFVLGAGRKARCLNAATGEQIWETRLPGEFRDEFMQACIAVADGAAVIMAGHLFGLDANDGQILWQGDHPTTGGSHSSPVVWEQSGRQLVIVNVFRGRTLCVEPRSGKLLWSVESQAGLATPVIAGDRMLTYGNSRKKGLRCFQLSDSGAEHLWTYNGVADKGSSPVVVGGSVFVQGERKLACVDLETGTSPWIVTLDRAKPQYTSLIAADRKVFYGHRGLLCFRASADDFQSLVDARINADGLMATEESFREMLGLNDLEAQPDGRKKSLRVYDEKVGRHGPLDCATPAIAHGRIVIRLKDRIACYDLRQNKVARRDGEPVR